MVINFRKKEILKAIIHEYILNAEPIGSRTLAKNYDFGIGSATIRNEMSDLEEMGYLEQPHTSAGRIPSDKGYRFYVDTILKVVHSDFKINELIGKYYNEKQSVQEIMSEMTTMLSKLTKYITMISEPQLKKSKVQQIQLISVTKFSLLVVLITNTGIVHNKIINLQNEINSKELNYLNNYLSNQLKGKEISNIEKDFLEEIEKKLIKRINLSQGIIESIYKELLDIVSPENFKVYTGGTSYILEQPEFNNLDNFKKVMNILNREEILKEIIEETKNERIMVKIGSENQLDDIKNCSLIFATYYLGNRAIGKIGVIGPTRMEYQRVISTVDSVAVFLGKLISKISG